MARTVSIERAYKTLEEGAELQITEVGGNLIFTIHREKPSTPVGIMLDPNEYFVPWTVNRLYLSRLGYCFIDKTPDQDRDSISALIALHALDSRPYAVIAWGATAADCLVLCWRPTFPEVPYTSSGQSIDVFSKIELFLPGFMDNAGKKKKAKVRLLSRINMMDQISELEKQIDLLTKILIAVVMKTTTAGERPAWWPRFRSIMETYDSTSLKGVDASLDDIEARKILIRQIISDYYQEQT